MGKAIVLAAALMAGACAGGPQPFVPDTARLPQGALGSGFDSDTTAVYLAQWAFASRGRTQGRPIEGARAAASMDYIAGQIYTSPRWSNVSALTKEQLLRGRVEVRTALGVVPGTSSQAVVDSLTTAGNALAAGDEAAAVAQLGAPVFDQPGEQVLLRLANLPYMQMANVSTMRAANELFDSSTRNYR
ncbi:MAG: hypothetical protein H7Z10_09250 [Gemmatimonadaceae bacterium]|nr:hypothetical protein [Acetobacteraceae bacterium]